jgi:pimeloyl-ACP methyl ester carboxylesterase
LISTTASSQKINYGNNPAAGHYLDVGNCKIYYEVYGQGKPFVLLHGGVYGYIDEFQPIIEKLSPHYQVICIATRGHGKSEIGRSPFSYQQNADDAYKVIRQMTKDSVMLLGFSDGGFTAAKLAAAHPDIVKKLVVIGAGYLSKLDEGEKRFAEQFTPETLMKESADLFKSRLALMPEPSRWRESLVMLEDMYNEEFVGSETFSKIKCPTLIMCGDRDEYSPTEDFLKSKQMIPNAQLAVIAGCGHVVFFCNLSAVWAAIEPFLNNK